jgi:hypothetical protein
VVWGAGYACYLAWKFGDPEAESQFINDAVLESKRNVFRTFESVWWLRERCCRELMWVVKCRRYARYIYGASKPKA